jgi:hypothetical protein
MARAVGPARWPRLVGALLPGLVLLAPGPGAAYEADVHFGLTRWLAVQAGFEEWQAELIAVGDQRVESGDMLYVQPLPGYACLAIDKATAQSVRQLHFPSAVDVPAPAEQRQVTAGGDEALLAVRKMEKSEPAQAAFRLYLVGVALHPLQDSWAHQGVPEIARPFERFGACDPTLAWASPHERGGWNSHKADLVAAWPADARAMAEATYLALQAMPPVLGVQRSARPWKDLAVALDGFLRATTKAQKRKWFQAQGIADVSFLEGITLPDGGERFEQHWAGRKLPPIPTAASTQHHIDAGLLEAMSRFFSTWIQTRDFDALAAEVAAPTGTSTNGVAPADRAELAARLRAWRVRDHGRVAELAHAPGPLSVDQRNTLAALAADPNQLARYEEPKEAFFPLLARGPEASPLLAFLTYPVDPAPGGNARAIAATKFRHAPYDTVEVLVERIDQRWRVLSIRAIVDH